MPNPKIATLVDAFTAPTINTVLWNNITGGTATLDTVNDQVALQQPTVNGATNTFGSNSLWDATSSAVYAQVGVVPNGNGGTKTIFKLQVDGSNNIAMRVEGGIFRLTVLTAGTTVTTTLPAYDAHAHRWWRLRESGGSFFAEASADGLNWMILATTTYSWSAIAMQFLFQTSSFTTEVAGNVALLSHLGTRSGGQANPNWPYMEFGAGLSWGANGGAIPNDVYVDVSTRTQDTVTISRGRQYELDQVRSGEESVTLGNTDGVLDPTSGTTPFAGHVQPFQPYRIRAQWPATVNLFSQAIATGGDVGGVALGTIAASTVLDLLSDTDTTGGSVVASATAWAGGRVTQFSVPNTAAVGQRIAHSAQVAVQPGQAYTVQVRVRDVTASTSLQVKPSLGWHTTAGTTTPASYTYGTTQTLTGSTTAGWTLLTVTGTAPAGAYGVDVGVAVAATAGALCSIQTDGWQMEKGFTASAWVCPGAWYPMYAGFSEDIPSQWNMSGTYGVVSPPAADAFSLLSQLALSDALTMEIATHSPRFAYRLDDPAGSMSAADSTGNNPAVPVASSKAGPGSLVFGTTITAANTTTGIYSGSPGTVTTINNPSPGSGSSAPATFLSLNRAGIAGPATPAFTRMIAFRYTGAMPTVAACMWSAIDANHGGIPSSLLLAYIDSSGFPTAVFQQFASGTGIGLTVGTDVADSNWHLLLFGYDNASGFSFISLDGGYQGGSAGAFLPQGIVSDSIGGFIDGTLGGAASQNFKGDLSFACEFPTMLTSTDCTNMYQAWKAACAGESTGARYARILRYAGYTGPSSIATGLTSGMGPADTAGQDVVSALQSVVDTENGAHFVARDGTITFLGRNARYNATVPAVIFGERADLGEWPYEDVQTVWDSTHLGNKVQVTQTGTGQVFYAQDATSSTAYFPRTLTRSVNTTSTLEAQDAANYLLSRYKQPLSRISSMVLHPSAQPAMWPTVLGMELSTRARVMRRPPNLPATQIDCFVENVAWSWDNTAEAKVTLQCSPADTTLYAVFAAWHTALNAGIASGVSTITVNASADTVNPLATQLAAGQQLVLGQNTANQETVTISAVGASSPGWTTCAIALTAPTTKSHSAGDLVNEPLPTGVTDPTTYDAASVFDSTVFAY